MINIKKSTVYMKPENKDKWKLRLFCQAGSFISQNVCEGFPRMPLHHLESEL